jgi:hypothetical protein
MVVQVLVQETVALELLARDIRHKVMMEAFM